ncbi:transcription termination factor MTEF1, chloroplastic-like [Argentina anserina]|uniref:transcription termination factor MTEF1, chloroplastic-like n=1 Tax=Argentina anserina TaxID=57926 RepID=UPI0021769432|nr:transcription termination factor MTEF1, chloroplastic-like [Potentilla anserina]
MPLLHSLTLLPTPSSSSSSSSSLVSSPHPNPHHFIKFRTSYRENLRHLKTLRIIPPDTKPNKLPLPDAAEHLLSTVNFLKSKGFSDSDFQRLAFLSPNLFSSNFDPTDVIPIFDFLANELSASPEQSCGLILRCPDLLFSDVEFCLRPTLHFLRQVGVEKLSTPTNLNAHLLNTRVEKLRAKVRFLRSLGLSYDEAEKVCERLPAIFGYSVEGNLMPKYEYLVEEMERSLEELKKFPQYFGFSLEKKIAPRHLHLKERNVRIPLNRMLLWSDQRFYAKWK